MQLFRFVFLCFLIFFACEDIGKDYNWQGKKSFGFTQKYGTIGYDYGWKAEYSPFDGGIIITGRQQTNVNGQTDLWAIKTNHLGLVEWEKTFGGSGNEEGYDVIATSDGGFLFIGYTWSFGSSQQFYAVKTDFHGNLEWEKTYGGSNWEVGTAVIEVTGGGYILAGYSNSPGISSGNTDVYLIKIDKAGNQIWDRAYGSAVFPHHEWAYDIIETPDQTLLVVGARDYYGEQKRNNLVLRIAMNGNLIWEKEIYESGVDEVAYSISYTHSGSYYICSKVNSISEPDVFQPKIIKIDITGNVDWQRTFAANGKKYHQFRATSTLGGDVVVVGSSGREVARGYDEDAFMVRIDDKGNIIWSFSYGTYDNDDWGWSAFETPNQNIVFVGSTKSFGASLFDIYLVGTNAEGISQ
jgi:hypothetical protein